MRQPGKLLPVRWRTVQADETGAVPLDDLLAPRDFVLGYLATFVASDRSGPAELRLDVADAVEVWWNDGLVASEETLDAGAPDHLVIPIQLQRGWNKLLIKSCVRRSAWSVAARVTAPGGAAWPGLKASAQPAAYTPVERAAQRDALAFGLAVVALNKPLAMLSALEQRPDPGQIAELLFEGFDMVSEDFDEEQFFAEIRRAYWTAESGSTRRRLAEMLIQKLEF